MNREWIIASDYGASGSEKTVTGKIKKGSCVMQVESTEDFAAGQGITAEGCFYHTYGTIYNDKKPYLAANQKALKDEMEIEGIRNEKFHQVFLIHFWEENVYSWMAVDPKYQHGITYEPFYWNQWQWQGEKIPVTDGWVDLLDGVRIRFRKTTGWLKGSSISFHARNRLRAKIVKVERNKLILDHAANVSCETSLVKHEDNEALQTALDAAIEQRKPLYIPAGRYRLDDGLWIRNASVRIEGADRVHTILDVSEAHTACFWISCGREVIIRNLRMEGHTGYLELHTNGSWRTASGFPFWPCANQQMEVYGCAAVNAVSTEYMLFEDLDITRMASEAIYLHGSDRQGKKAFIQQPHEGLPGLEKQFQKTCIINRCNGYDTAFNLFNNNDHAENTIVTNCRGEKMGNFCENAAEFSRFTNNYCCDCTCLTICSHGLAIVTDNVFEGGKRGFGVLVHGNKAVISNNIFRKFSKSAAIDIHARGPVSVTGNVIDLSRDDNADTPDNLREGIAIYQGQNAVIADNHIIVDGPAKSETTGIMIGNVENVNIHDNMIENCTYGFRCGYREWDSDRKEWIWKDIDVERPGLKMRDNTLINCKQ